MMNMLAHNMNRGIDEVRLFEMGDVYEAEGAGTLEHSRVCLAATLAALKNWLPQGCVLEKKNSSDVDVFRMFKGDVETLLNAFQHKSLTIDGKAAEYYRPGLSARMLMEGEVVAQLGQLHPQIAAARKLRQDVFIAEIFSDKLYKRRLREVLYRPLPKFPAVERDFSFLFDDEVTFDKIEAAISSLRLPELRSFDPVEIFRGGTVPAGHYSILLRAKFQSLERTLREEEVADWSAQIVNALKALGGTQRA
jgi:phenylalanyl-tRNA synthetase beta chain